MIWVSELTVKVNLVGTAGAPDTVVAVRDVDHADTPPEFLALTCTSYVVDAVKAGIVTPNDVRLVIGVHAAVPDCRC